MTWKPLAVFLLAVAASGCGAGEPVDFVAAGGVPLRIVVADDTNVPRARIYDDSDVLLEEVGLQDTRVDVTRDLWEAELDKVRLEFGESAALEQKLGDWGRPTLTPAFHGLQVDAAGRLWVLRQEGSRRLAAVHVEGRPVAHAEMPHLAEIFEIGLTYIVGLHRDPLGVESVRVDSYATP